MPSESDVRDPRSLLVMAGRATTCALAAVMLTACGGGGGGGGGSGTTRPPTTYTIGGTVSGLAASGLTLNDNGGNTVTVSSGATTFTFSTALASGTAYAVTVASQPNGEMCTVSSGTGTATANVTSVVVSCGASPNYTIGGSITGLTESGLTLDDNGGDTLTVASGATTFTFSTALQSGATYDVTVDYAAHRRRLYAAVQHGHRVGQCDCGGDHLRRVGRHGEHLRRVAHGHPGYRQRHRNRCDIRRACRRRGGFIGQRVRGRVRQQ